MESLRAYAESGWLHRQKVREEVLPAAVFYRAEILESVRQWRAFLREFPNYARVGEARAAMHQLYSRALENLRKQADPNAASFLPQLVGWIEAHESPDVEVRFERPSAQLLMEADRLLAAKGGGIDGVPVAPVSPSFTDSQCENRETQIAETLDGGFRAIVPKEILHLVHGARLTGGSGTFAKPTLAINYTIKPSNVFYYPENKSRAFVGISVAFTITLSLPGSDSLQFDLDVAPPDRFTVTRTTTRRFDSSAPADSTVYDVMAAEAFARLDRELRDVFFRPP